MKIIQKNKKAAFDYEVLETFTAGMMLTGPEIKSVRAGHINLTGSYVSLEGGVAWLRSANITRYPYARIEDYDPFRPRKLLLKKSETDKIMRQLNTKGVTLIPLAVGLVGAFAKCSIALARGRKKHDKREVIKAREQKRGLDRLMKQYR